MLLIEGTAGEEKASDKARRKEEAYLAMFRWDAMVGLKRKIASADDKAAVMACKIMLDEVHKRELELRGGESARTASDRLFTAETMAALDELCREEEMNSDPNDINARDFVDITLDEV